MNAAAAVLKPESDVPPRSQYVLAGQVYVATEPTRFSTVLGSCVAVCLFDLGLGIGGINHVQMPGTPPAHEKENDRWAAFGTQRLIELMCQAGASASTLRAKVFGGACVSTRRIPEGQRIGDQNVNAVLAVLREHRIRISNSSTGGDTGIKVLFDSHTGSAWVKRLVQRT